jgi:hypothetical protein
MEQGVRGTGFMVLGEEGATGRGSDGARERLCKRAKDYDLCKTK